MTLREIGLWLHEKSAKWRPLTWLIHGIVALPFVALVAWRRELAPMALLGFIEAEHMWFRYLVQARRKWVDVALDVAVIPLLALVAWIPWTGPGAMFALREARQMRTRYLDGVPLDWLDHTFDVLVPGCVGWLFLR